MATPNTDLCYYTNKNCDLCFDAIDTPPSIKMSDETRTIVCCNSCRWILTPLTIVLDMICCPIRCFNILCTCNTCTFKNTGK